MRKPDIVEQLYLDFDGFFASVEQQARPFLRGRPVGVVPFAGTDRTCIIACSREAKMAGVKGIMSIPEARSVCPDLILVPQTPDLYRRAHNALISEISAVIPIAAVKSIDELTCQLGTDDREDPQSLGLKIKNRLQDNIGSFITCSMGFAANRQLAKMACKAGKWDNKNSYGNGLTIWHPKNMPTPLFKLSLDDIPGIGSRMKKRLLKCRIFDMADLLRVEPKHMRKLWNSVTGERLWYALHGYEIQTPPTNRGMIGHSRVLPPDHRSSTHAHSASRLLLTKAVRRLRREEWNAGRLWLWLSIKTQNGFSSRQQSHWLPAVHDDHSVLSALEDMWRDMKRDLPSCAIMQVSVTLADLTPASERQLDLLLNDDPQTQKWEAVTKAIDHLNGRYGQTLVSLGEWSPPPGGYAGGKISFTRVPSADDFW